MSFFLEAFGRSRRLVRERKSAFSGPLLGSFLALLWLFFGWFFLMDFELQKYRLPADGQHGFRMVTGGGDTP